MNSRKSKNVPTSGGGGNKNRFAVKFLLVLLGAAGLFAAGYFSMDARIKASQSQKVDASDQQDASRPAAPEYRSLIGRWQRTDGGYIIDIRKVEPNGLVDAAYFNSNPIHISQAQASVTGTTLQLFIELRDTGYPGATYQLLYYPQQKSLAGIYHQPAAGGSFDVVFMKME